MTVKPSYEELERRVQELEKIESELEYSRKALRESEDLFKRLYEKAPLGYQSLDENGHFIVVNQTWLDTLGYVREEVMGKSFSDFLHPDWRDHFKENFPRFKSIGEILGVEFEMVKKNGNLILVSFTGKISRDKKGNFQQTHCIFHDITERKRAEASLKQIEWMLSKKSAPDDADQGEDHDQGYGDLTELNRDGIILKSIGHERLKSFATDYLELLGTSSAIYEGNGDYAFGIFASGYCRMTDGASRKLCDTPDNVEAFNSGRWLCHESCWTDCSQKAITNREQVDIECNGGIRIYAVPIFAGGNVIGAINFGYGDPPKDPEKLKMLADVYHLNYDDLLREATAYESRPPYIIEMAKKRLNSTAKLIGSMVETKQAMEALRQSEEKHRRLFETMAQGVVYHAADGVIISANPAAERILGLSFDQMRGKTFMDPRWQMIKEDGTALPGTDHPAMIALRTGETIGPVVRGVFHPDKNSHVWLSITAIPLFQPGETKPFQVYATFEDITERRRAEEVLRENENILNITGQIAKIGGWELYPETMKVTWTDETYRIHEVPKSIKPPLNDAINFWHPEDQPILRKAIQQALDNGIPYDLELRFITAKGRNLYARTKCNPVLRNGKVVKLQGFFHDITERKQAEMEKEKLQAQLLQAQKMESVGRLAGGVAHDFNNMLGVILGHVEFALEKTQENHDLYPDLKEIQTAAKRSADITKQLLAFARKEIISPRQLDLNDTVESMLNMLRRLIGEDIVLVWKPSAHLWPVKMDPSQIDQILANLCVNARDAIAGVGKLTIETGRHTFDEEYCNDHSGFIPGDFVLLAVSDNGCGMDKETLNNLFEPFFTTKEVGKGTGLGLATIYGIVKQNNGFINVYSESDQGSTFKIYLPRLVADEDADRSVGEKKAVVGGTETILLVEDEPSILRMIQMMLKRKGYTVLSAASPTEAFEKAKNHSGSIDLLMTDVIMPEMNGRDLAEKITDIYPNIRLLFMSGYTADVIDHHGILDEGVAFIQKPFSNANLAQKLRDVLDTASDKTQV